jgi:protein arginine kinase activator
MQCESCQAASATIHLTHIVDSVLRKIDLCEACARLPGNVDPSTTALMALLIGRPDEADDLSLGAEGDRRCRRCGCTEADFKKAGRVGCGACYEFLGEALHPTLRQTQKCLTHRGKFPRRASTSTVITPLLEGLQREFQEAVRLGLGPQAAALEEQIRRFEEMQRRAQG